MTFTPQRQAATSHLPRENEGKLPANTEPQLHVIISPHFDDGVFSCGGTASELTAAGHAVLVITMMGGLFHGELPDTPILADLHQRWRAGDDPLRQRQIEDEQASQTLGVDFMHVPLPDCVYRLAGDLALYPSEESLFADVHPADYAPRLLKGIQIPELETATRIYLPLGVGHHVDHQIVRDWGLTQMRGAPGPVAAALLCRIPVFPRRPVDRGGAGGAEYPAGTGRQRLWRGGNAGENPRDRLLSFADQHVLGRPGVDGNRGEAGL